MLLQLVIGILAIMIKRRETEKEQTRYEFLMLAMLGV